MNKLLHKTNFIRQMSHKLGFSFCGIAKVQRLDEDARKLESWLKKACMELCITWKNTLT